jgi:hypothetical protein
MTASFWLDNFLSQKCHFSFKLYLNEMFLIPTHHCLYAIAFFQFTTKCDLKHLGVALPNLGEMLPSTWKLKDLACQSR